jgi:hypothetical protein
MTSLLFNLNLWVLVAQTQKNVAQSLTLHIRVSLRFVEVLALPFVESSY